MRIEVAGIPAPQGNHRVSKAGAIYETSRAVGPWREAVRTETQRAMNGDGPATRAVAIWLNFFLPRPKSAPKSVQWPVKRPDIDKLARAVLDGLVAGGALMDDSQVVSLVATKRFADEDHSPGCRIETDEVLP